jgi:hypothetical protein
VTEVAQISCVFCKGVFDVETFLESLSGYSTSTDSGVALCPHCRKGIEFRARSGKLELGYTYWSGSMHFEGMETAAASGLRRVVSPEGVTVEYRGVTYPKKHSP